MIADIFFESQRIELLERIRKTKQLAAGHLPAGPTHYTSKKMGTVKVTEMLL
jgi:hypothetical protein